jgi:hypothetical protein
MAFFDIAKPMAERGVPQIRIRPNSKAAFDKEWPQMATTDLQRLAELSAEIPNCNGASVAQARVGGFWFLEVDSPDVVKRIEEETGQQIPATFRVRSRPGRGHFYWKHTPASIAMGNLSQSYVRHGDFSVRADNQYVVSANSIHPHSQLPYTALREEDVIIECPDWLVFWLQSQRVEKKAAETEIKKDAHGLIEHGFIHGWLVSQAGRLRNIGLDIDTLETTLVKLAEENCAPPLDLAKVRQVARSFAKYEAGQSGDILFKQQEPVAVNVQEEVELPTFENEPYPVFPAYVMEGTSLYENFVKPVCDKNSRIAYFMWLPAMTILLNYIGPKIKIKRFGGLEPFRGSIYEVLIGRKGKTNKSSCINDAKNYFNYIGCLMQHSRDVKNADAKTLAFTIGSAEGLGIEMQKTNCRNALLSYDELSQLVSKIGIESSSLASGLLQMYEAAPFANGVKSGKESFSLQPDTYCTSLIAATTDSKFAELWSKLAGSDTGLDDRFMFILQPEILPEPKLKTYVNTIEGSMRTKVLIDKAIQQAEFAFEDSGHPGLLELNEIENRFAIRAEKWAVGIAIDLGLDIVDDECVARAVDIVKYEMAVKRYLKSYEATTREGEIQMSIRRVLEMARGRMGKRDLERKLNAGRHGTSLWKQAYKGLLLDGIFREEGAGTKADPIMLQLLRKRDVFDE